VIDLAGPDCGGCELSDRGPRSRCRDAFKAVGLRKMHWECWSDCNLHCPFCFRTEDRPVETECALKLIDICRYGGAVKLVFAGGDPSLRADLPVLVDHAADVGFSVEVQSNFQIFRPALKSRLRSGKVCLSGISLDGASPDSHDRFRATRGNFNAVVSALDFHEKYGLPVIVRSILTSANEGEFSQLARLVSKYSVVQRWSLLEFSPVGLGFANRRQYEISRERFDHVSSVAASLLRPW
jgi:MoaA/NifB/PqqE/SkfB family radical SAM enzyme